MKQVIFLTISIIIIGAFSGCEKDNETISISLIEKSCTHSYEENTPELFNIYRPSDYKEFPPSRYRHVFIFKANNLCDYKVLAPNDAHYMKNGKWEYDENQNVVKVMNNDSDILYEFEIIEIKEGLLKISHQ